jgi:hypothetical protein
MMSNSYMPTLGGMIKFKQNQQEKAAFNEHNPHMTQQQELEARSLGGPQTKTGQSTRQSTDRLITKMIHKKI